MDLPSLIPDEAIGLHGRSAVVTKPQAGPVVPNLNRPLPCSVALLVASQDAAGLVHGFNVVRVAVEFGELLLVHPNNEGVCGLVTDRARSPNVIARRRLVFAACAAGFTAMGNDVDMQPGFLRQPAQIGGELLLLVKVFFA